MAKFFLSHAMKDERLALSIQKGLERAGHMIHVPVGTLPFGRWREKLWDALRGSDVCVALLTSNGLKSPYVASEVGAAREFERTAGMLVLPVCEKNKPIPLFVADYACELLNVNSDASVRRAIRRMCNTIDQHQAERPATVRVFISHRHKDKAEARALVALLNAAFDIEPSAIRCTSLDPYKLDAGERTSERLRAEIAGAEVVLGLLAPDTSESEYVLAELGAGWGVDVPTFPLRFGGAQFSDVPEPLNERHSLCLDEKLECLQLIRDLARVTGLVPRSGAEAEVSKKAGTLARTSRRARK